jgi:hypothetical protein
MKTGLLLGVALAAGLGLGLLYSWVISPVEIVDTAPEALSAQAQTDYVRLVARAFAAEGDLGRARTRLALLGWTAPAEPVTALAQRLAAEGQPEAQVQVVAQLAAALGAGPATTTPAAVAQLTSSPASPAETPGATVPPSASASQTAAPSATPSYTPQPTDTVIPSITPRLLATRTPTATPPGAFDFIGRQAVCDPDLAEPLLQVVAESATGAPVPGVEVVVTWDGGFDHFYTGLKPELGRGYGDFTMTPGVVYTVHLAESPSITLEGLTVEACGAGLASYPGSWLLVFRQPGS